jgi:hypothetical protein
VLGQRLEHKSFGQGHVIAIIDSRRLKVQFAEAEKTLIQGLIPHNREAAAPAAEVDAPDTAAAADESS